MKEFEARYIGWPGITVPDEIGQQSLTNALAEKVKEALAAVNLERSLNFGHF